MTKKDYANLCKNALIRYQKIGSICAEKFGSEGIVVQMVDLTRNKISLMLNELVSTGLSDNEFIPKKFQDHAEKVSKELNGWTNVIKESFNIIVEE